MKIVNVHEAKAHLSEYLAAAERGEEIVIARRNKPVARLVPLAESEPRRKPRKLGQARGRIKIHPSFYEPMDEKELGLWDGSRMLPSDPLNPDFDPAWTPDGDKTE